ncbi:MAG: nucleotidyltransferase domain-containing protein [Phycisphaerae bacterium]
MALPETARRQAQRLARLQAEARRIAAELARQPAVRRVIMFGSAARGEARTSSDLDLIVVMQTDAPFLKRWREVWQLARPQVPTDLLVYTPAEFEQLLQTRAFVRSAVREGTVLYDAETTDPSTAVDEGGPG